MSPDHTCNVAYRRFGNQSLVFGVLQLQGSRKFGTYTTKCENNRYLSRIKNFLWKENCGVGIVKDWTSLGREAGGVGPSKSLSLKIAELTFPRF